MTQRYHRFFASDDRALLGQLLAEHIAGFHEAALEFAANIGKRQFKGIDLIKFSEAGE